MKRKWSTFLLAVLLVVQVILPAAGVVTTARADNVFVVVDSPNGSYSGFKHIEISGWAATFGQVTEVKGEVTGGVRTQTMNMSISYVYEPGMPQGYGDYCRFRAVIDVTCLKPYTTHTLKITGSHNINYTRTFYVGDITPATYTVTFNDNGGSGGPGSMKITQKAEGASIVSKGTIPTTIPTRTGYDFLGWSTSKTATSATYTAGKTISVSGNSTLYAVWKARTCTVSFDANGGSGGPGSVTGNYGSTVTIPSAEPQKDNYEFLGWSTSASATAAEYEPGDSYTINAEATTLYAVWEPGTCILQFDANGGDEAPKAIVGKYGEIIRLPYDWPERELYIFRGWSENSRADWADYDPGAAFTFTERVTTLYAVWKPIPGEIVFDANGGSNAPDGVMGYDGQKVTIPAEVPVREHYEFLGWSMSDDAEAAEYQPGDVYTISKEKVVLYAVWKPVTCTVGFDANGGSGAPDEISAPYGSTVTLPAEIPAKEHYNFLGWSVLADGTVAEYQPGDSYTVNAEETTLYAVWEAKNCTVSFDANGGSNAPDEVSAPYGSTATLPAEVPQKDHYNFLGWSALADAAAAEYQPGDSYEMLAEENTLYAVWEAKNCTVSFDANSGSNAPGSISAPYGSTVTLPAEVPEKEFYIFLGWSASADAASAEYQPGGDYTMAAETATLYAVWEEDENAICGVNVRWRLDENGVLWIKGTGDMYDFATTSEIPWYQHRQKVKKIMISDGITSIGDKAFYGCINTLGAVVPESVADVGENAFRNCDKAGIYSKWGSFAQEYAEDNRMDFYAMFGDLYVHMYQNDENWYFDVRARENVVNATVVVAGYEDNGAMRCVDAEALETGDITSLKIQRSALWNLSYAKVFVLGTEYEPLTDMGYLPLN